jgi:hypothetical protein
MFTFFDRTEIWKIPECDNAARAGSAGHQGLHDYWLIAGGLALVLSRCPRDLRHRRFKAASQLYAQLEKYRRGAPADIDPELICDASHEVAEFTDRPTRDALLRRMRAIS